MLGKILSHFQILKKLGQGGMGEYKDSLVMFSELNDKRGIAEALDSLPQFAGIRRELRRAVRLYAAAQFDVQPNSVYYIQVAPYENDGKYTLTVQ